MRGAFPLVALLLFVALLFSPAPAESTKPLAPFNVPVNTEADEDDPHVGGNGLALFFTTSQDGKYAIRTAQRRQITQRWPSRSEELEDYLKEKGELRSAYATTGRYPHYLYFGTRDPRGKNFDLFVAVQQDAGKAWSAPTPVMNVNSEADEVHPWLGNDGRSLYFSRKMRDGWRVLLSTRPGVTGPGGWTEPEILELPLDFHHATLTPDGKTMYLQGPLEKGRWGVFVCRREGGGWSKPTPLDRLNHPEGKKGDHSPNLSRDGRILYFASDRPGSKGGLDLWGIAIAELQKK